jgi:hypothetical protein
MSKLGSFGAFELAESANTDDGSILVNRDIVRDCVFVGGVDAAAADVT